ncbi:hypothetical protein W97_00247 [Coniosporium apollinis CBS 100218]|uniref:Major facilitator superfamily (MFS) profile domain-containing protein n=1 Tax=Coniosporium apollinis (strain CBS 100218) TaxID=1168221 RepID=R7YGL3_CONA1|nr:uncharacterized protein W97_00247 [Coniosporium apollinis CBS 100218]EON61037.1 hypothetical protein W97_00247 [Coniosporium apollinis CBS 100218]
MEGLDTLQRVTSQLPICGYQDVKPLGLRWRSNTLFIISTVAVGLFTDLFLYGLIVPVLPFMLKDRVGLPQDQVQTHTSVLLALYAAASVVFSPVAGVFADRMTSRQLPFLFGLVALLLATIILAIGQSIAVLAIARILQGVSGAVVWTIGLAMCIETVGPENLGKTIGTIFSIISVGTLAAPVLGGILYDKTGYEGVFGVGVAFLAIDFIMRLLVVEKKIAKRYESKDGERQQDEEEGPDTEETPLLSSSENSKYKLPETRSRIVRAVPILACITDRSILAALLVCLIQATLLGSFDATIPTIASDYYGFDSLHDGLLFLPLGAADLIVGPIAGWATDRFGTKVVAAVGYFYLVPVLILLRLPHPGDIKQVIFYGATLALCGVGEAIVGAPSIVEAGAVVQRYHRANPGFFGEEGPYAQLYGANSMVFSAGLTLGPLVAGGLKDKIGYGNMNAVIAVVCFVTAVVSFLFIGGKPSLPWRSWSR